MTLLRALFLFAIAFFGFVFYNSFFFGEKILFLSHRLSQGEFLFILYLFLSLSIYVCKEKKSYAYLLLHALLSTSVFYIQEYSLFVFLQFTYLLFVVRFGNNLLSDAVGALYLLSIYKGLLLLFAAESYLLYLLNLFAIIFFFKQNKAVTSKKAVRYLFFAGIFLLLYESIREFIFDFYIWLDIRDKNNLLHDEVLYVLTLLHFFIFLFLKQSDIKNFKKV
jgi:hypothetical protein